MSAARHPWKRLTLFARPLPLVGMAFVAALALAWLLTERAIADVEFEASVSDVAQAVAELNSRSPSMGALAPIDEIDRRIDAQEGAGEESMIYAVRRQDGRMVTGNIRVWPDPAPGTEIRAFRLGENDVAAVGTVRPFGKDFEMLVGRRMVTLSGVRFRLLLIFGLVLASGLALVTGLFWHDRARTRRIVATMGRDLQAAASGTYSERVEVPRDPDFANIAQRANFLLERIEASNHSLRHLAANIAHELCHPLIGAMADCERIALQDGSAGEAATRILARLESMDETFRGLLSLTQIESGIDDAGTFETFDLAAVARDAREIFLDHASMRNVRIVPSLESCVIFGSPLSSSWD